MGRGHWQSLQCTHPVRASRRQLTPHVFELVVMDDQHEVACHARSSLEQHQTCHDGRQYIDLVQRKPGALRNRAPFSALPGGTRQQQQLLIR